MSLAGTIGGRGLAGDVVSAPAQPPRITSLDVLRGVGVLGMLVTHIQSFSSVTAARANPTVLGEVHGLNWWLWLGTHVLADGKFATVFSLLFGASIVLLADRAETQGLSAERLHYRRMAILLVIGLLHAHLLWYGDMLVPMAVCGALAFLYRRLAPTRLITLGILVFAVAPALSMVLAWMLPSRPAALAEAMQYWSPSSQTIAWEVSRYRGGWLEQMDHRVPTALTAATSSLATRGLWQLTGVMLLGAALFKLGILGASRSARFYATVATLGFGLGVPMILWGVSHSVAHGWALRDYRLVGEPLNYVGGTLVAFGWIGVVLWLCRTGHQLGALAAVGRMAMTNYLLQTLICTTIFYGHGLGLFGHVDRLGQLGIVLGIWGFQLAVSVWWLRCFALGPMEWLWRCLTSGRWLRMRRLQPVERLAPFTC